MAEEVAYEVRVMGRLGPAACQAFGEMSVAAIPPITVLRAALDQAGLHDLLELIQALGFEVVDVRRV